MFNLYNKFVEKSPIAREAILYLFIGGSAVLIDALIFLLLYNIFNISAVFSTFISITFATVYSYYLNSRYNFKKSDKDLYRFISFCLISALGMIVSASMIYTLDRFLDINPNISKMISLPIIALMQFILNKLLTFR